MISKPQFHLNVALIFAILAFVTYPPDRHHANYFMTWLMGGICTHHFIQFVLTFITLLDRPAKVSN